MEQFGKFELIEKIGQGGMAEVFRARPIDVTLAKTIAIKRINIHCMDDELFRDMFQREAEIALRFRHPGIVAVHEFGSINKIPYMSMEYLSGKSLAELILILKANRDAIDMGSKLLIIKTVCEALHYIHEFSDFGDSVEIIHRDISPPNILVGFDGRTKLIDFGIAKINEMNGPTRSTVFKGKVAYMSPEQSLGETLTHKTDIFSLGIVLWELLCGRKLFTGNSVGEIGAQIQDGQVPPLIDFAPDAPAELRTVCRIALSVDPSARYKSAREMGSELEAILKKYYPQADHRHVAKCLRDLYPKDFETAQRKVKEQTTAAENVVTRGAQVQVTRGAQGSRGQQDASPRSSTVSATIPIAMASAPDALTKTLPLPLPSPAKSEVAMIATERIREMAQAGAAGRPHQISPRQRGSNQLVLANADSIELELITHPTSPEITRSRQMPKDEFPNWVMSIAVFFLVISIVMVGKSLTQKYRNIVNTAEFASTLGTQPRR